MEVALEQVNRLLDVEEAAELMHVSPYTHETAARTDESSDEVVGVVASGNKERPFATERNDTIQTTAHKAAGGYKGAISFGSSR